MSTTSAPRVRLRHRRSSARSGRDRPTGDRAVVATLHRPRVSGHHPDEVMSAHAGVDRRLGAPTRLRAGAARGRRAARRSGAVAQLDEHEMVAVRVGEVDEGAEGARFCLRRAARSCRLRRRERRSRWSGRARDRVDRRKREANRRPARSPTRPGAPKRRPRTRRSRRSDQARSVGVSR